MSDINVVGVAYSLNAGAFIVNGKATDHASGDDGFHSEWWADKNFLIPSHLIYIHVHVLYIYVTSLKALLIMDLLYWGSSTCTL